MSFGMRMRTAVKQELSTRVAISQELRHEISQKIFGLRLDLISALRDERYTPKAHCPKCRKELTAGEILEGFNRNPNDFTTGCPKCNTRFEPMLISFGEESSVSLPFWCSMQVLHHLEGKEIWPPKKMALEEPGLYRSAIVHYGTLKAAFAKIGAKYEFEEIHSWRHLVLPFLGKMPDVAIADCVGVSPATIGRMRRETGISRFSKAKLAEKMAKRRSKRK